MGSDRCQRLVLVFLSLMRVAQCHYASAGGSSVGSEYSLNASDPVFDPNVRQILW